MQGALAQVEGGGHRLDRDRAGAQAAQDVLTHPGEQVVAVRGGRAAGLRQVAHPRQAAEVGAVDAHRQQFARRHHGIARLREVHRRAEEAAMLCAVARFGVLEVHRRRVPGAVADQGAGEVEHLGDGQLRVLAVIEDAGVADGVGDDGVAALDAQFELGAFLVHEEVA